MKHRSTGNAARVIADGLSALLCLFMLCVVPLLFRDAFFDINRVKVSAVIAVVPLVTILWSAAVLLGAHRKEKVKAGAAASACMALFAASAILACAVNGFEPSMLTGDKGRYCGLYFTLSCAAGFFVISSGRFSCRRLVPLIVLCSSICSLLGVLNVMGVDPLGFYTHIKKGQEQVFLSTIGHFDFFGTFLIMVFGLSGGCFVFAKRPCDGVLAAAASFVLCLGMSASRTDSAFAGMHLVCISLIAVSGGACCRISRALFLWAGAFLSLPAVYTLLPLSPYHPQVSGLPLMMYENGYALAAGAVLIIAAAVFAVLQHKGIKAPGRRPLMLSVLVVVLCAVLLTLTLMVYFSVFEKEKDLGGLTSVLRFNDKWGSLRGFAYIRSLRAFDDYTLIEKLFGRGMETTLSTLTPYFDNEAMLSTGVFNDPHCQLLQFLLTCGVFGAMAFAAFYLAIVVTVAAQMRDDPVLCGIFASMIGYAVILAINVTQPILISTYFSLSALAISRIRTIREEGEACES